MTVQALDLMMPQVPCGQVTAVVVCLAGRFFAGIFGGPGGVRVPETPGGGCWLIQTIWLSGLRATCRITAGESRGPAAQSSADTRTDTG